MLIHGYTMKGFHLTPTELIELRLAHRKARLINAPEANKINSIILLGTGWKIKDVKNALLLDDDTLRTYVELYRKGGIELLIKTNYQGRECRLSDIEFKELCEELDSTIYLTTKSVSGFVQKAFNKTFSQSGMRDLLHRIGYVYKKPKLVPGNPDKDAQEIFVEQYEEFMENKSGDVEVLFADAVHPEHNTIAACGWIKRGETREIKTNSGRARLNLHGALNIETLDVVIIESETVNAESTINLLQAIEQKYFMSSYSPNLNPIERLWKYFKKSVLYNTYYEDLSAFRKACIHFFRNINDHMDGLSSLLHADFEVA
jgi:transposase